MYGQLRERKGIKKRHMVISIPPTTTTTIRQQPFLRSIEERKRG
jgi:hypothetical protein